MNVATLVKALKKMPQDAEMNFKVNENHYAFMELRVENVTVINTCDDEGNDLKVPKIEDYDTDVYLVLE